MIRVLVVDDSAFARKVIRETLSEKEGFTLVGHARDGLEALEIVAREQIDVVTLDLVMPNLDGIGFLRTLRSMTHPPRVVVVSMSGADSALGVQALQEGAFDIVNKPTAQPTAQLYELSAELREKVRAAAAGHLRAFTTPQPAHKIKKVKSLRATKRSVLVVGTSTGGPPALTRLLSDLPADFPIPVAMVLHIPPGYTQPLAERLDQISQLTVVEASEGLLAEAGMAILAQAGVHMRLAREADGFRVRLSYDPIGLPHRPAVDVLFDSVVAEGDKALAVVLTGMGDDGLLACRALVKAGATVLTEAEESCVVYGMPRVVHEEKLSTAQASIGDMANLIVRHL